MGVGFVRTASEEVASIVPVDYAYEPGDIRRYGGGGAKTELENKTALDVAIQAVKNSGGVVVVPWDCDYGYVATSSATWPNFSQVTSDVTVVDYSKGSTYSPPAKDGAQLRLHFHTAQLISALSFTGSILPGATNATLSSSWGLSTGVWRVSFSNGDTRGVSLTQGATTATWSGGLSSGASNSATYQNPGQHDGNFQFIKGDWHPGLWIDNDGGPSNPRTSADNRRASIFFGRGGVACWRLGQGSLSGDTPTDNELSNFTLVAFDGPKSGGAPVIVSLSTLNWLFNTGSNSESANYHFKAGSSGYLNMLVESVTTETRMVLRNSDGSTDDVEIINQDGRMDFKIASQGVAFSIIKATRDILIGTTTDDASAKLQVASTTQGFLPPRMTTTQRNAISSPTPGLIIYNTTTGKLNVRGASAWEAITSA